MFATGVRYATTMVLVAVAGLAGPRPACAQKVHPYPFVDAGVGVQTPAAGTFQQTVSFAYRLETATETSAYQVTRGLTVDVGGGVMVTPRFGVSVAFDRFSNARSADYTLTLPHPLIFGAPTTHSSTSEALTHLETAVHVDVVFELALPQPFALVVFGGPSRVRVSQPVIKDVQFTETLATDLSYDFTLTGADLQTDTASAWGFNAGGTFLYLVRPNLGVGGTVRLIRARVHIDEPLQTLLQGHAVTTPLDAGGLVVGAAVHVRF
jgi:hypothetical protein